MYEIPIIKNNKWFEFLIILLILIILVTYYYLVAPMTCYFEVEAANNAPVTLKYRWMLFYALSAYLYLTLPPLIGLILSTYIIRYRVVYCRSKARNQKLHVFSLKRELFMLYLPVGVLYLAALILFYLVTIIYDPIIYKEDFLLFSGLGFILVLSAGAYVGVYGVWGVIVKNKLSSFINGLSASLASGVLGLFTVFLVHGIGDYFFYTCDPSRFGIVIVNPNAGVFIIGGSLLLSKIAGMIVGFMVFLWIYKGFLKRFLED